MIRNKYLIYITILISLLVLTACSKMIPVDKTTPTPTPTVTPSNSSEQPDSVNPQETEASEETRPSEELETDKSSIDTLSGNFLFENSDKVKLKMEDIAGYDHLMLQFGVNEIYARKGYPFKDEHLKQYFEKQSWYKLDENFNESHFSDVEKSNITFLKNQNVMLSIGDIHVDFNGDGIKENITVDESILTQVIDREEKWKPWDDSYMGAVVTDIDITDGERELILFDAGPSADFSSALCRYNPTTQDWTIVKVQTSQYYDHESDGKGYIKFEISEKSIFGVGLYAYKQGALTLKEILYPNYTLSKTLGNLQKGTIVTIEPIEANPEKGENAALKVIEVAHPDNSEILYAADEPLLDFAVYFDVMQEYFDEVTEMYYGD